MATKPSSLSIHSIIYFSHTYALLAQSQRPFLNAFRQYMLEQKAVFEWHGRYPHLNRELERPPDVHELHYLRKLDEFEGDKR